MRDPSSGVDLGTERTARFLANPEIGVLLGLLFGVYRVVIWFLQG